MENTTATVQAPTNAPTGSAGGAALQEFADLLTLRQRPVLVGVAGTVVLGLLLALVAPGVLSPSAITGALVGIVAVLVGVVVAVLVDGADPVLRGPRHLRRDGLSVLGGMHVADKVGGRQLLDVVAARVAANGRVRFVISGVNGVDGRAFATTLGRAAAGADLTTLVVDLTSISSGPGIADVGAGRVRLGEAATLAADRPYASVGAGPDADAAIGATAALAIRPPSDLKVLLIVSPPQSVGLESLHEAVDKVLLVLPVDKVQRSEVTARVAALRRSGATVECVVVSAADASDAGIAPFADAGAPTAAAGSPIAPMATEPAPVVPQPAAPVTPVAQRTSPEAHVAVVAAPAPAPAPAPAAPVRDEHAPFVPPAPSAASVAKPDMDSTADTNPSPSVPGMTPAADLTASEALLQAAALDALVQRVTQDDASSS